MKARNQISLSQLQELGKKARKELDAQRRAEEDPRMRNQLYDRYTGYMTALADVTDLLE